MTVAVTVAVNLSWLDCRLTMADHVTAVCRTGYFWLRQQLRSVVQSLTSEAADSLVHAFISCRLDYRNALLYIYRFYRLISYFHILSII